MSKALSTKRFALVLKDRSKYLLDEKEAELIRRALVNGSDFVEIGDNLISRYDISRLVGSENYEEAERIRGGEWKCGFCGRWHPRYEQCGCQGGAY